VRAHEFITESFPWRNKNKIYSVLLNTIGSGPFDGGCVTFARALQLCYGGQIMVLVGHAQRSVLDKPAVAQHAVLQLNDKLIDADGVGSPQEVVARFAKHELTPVGGKITSIRPLRDSDLDEAPRDEEVSKQIAELLKKRSVAEGESNDTAISLSKLAKFHSGADPLAEFVPERATARYALHPDKWESTFYSLTNKDSNKLKYYGPKKISIPAGTLVGDMAIANQFYRAKTPEEKEHYAKLYKQSLRPYPVDVSKYRMPELLIPKESVAEGREQDYLSQVPNLTWKPVSRSVWNTIQDEGLDEEQDAPKHTDWIMASLTISPEDSQALQAFDSDAIEDFNRFDIHLKSRHPGLTDLIDYDNGTVTIVKPSQMQGLSEGMSFSPAIEEPYDDPKGKHKTIWSGSKWYRKEMQDCWFCDGTGIDPYRNHACDRCDGKGKTEEHVSDAPELSVSNANGYEIQRMLGLNPDYSGIIYHQDLPKFIRHLIKLKNTGSQQYTQEPSDKMGSMGVTGQDQNVTSIGRQGPRMVDMGRSQSQVDRYIDELLKLFQFAQQHGASIHWG